MPDLSYSRRPDTPLLKKIIPEVLSEMAARLPDQTALVVRHQKTRLTYRQLRERVEEVARGLTGLGLKPGDRIGVRHTIFSIFSTRPERPASRREFCSRSTTF